MSLSNRTVPIGLYSKNFNTTARLPYLEVEALIKSQKILHILTIAGKEYKVIIQEVQRHPVSSQIIHIDCRIITNTEKRIKVRVPLILVDHSKCNALKLGAILVQTTRYLNIFANPESIPNSIEFSMKDVKPKTTISTKLLKLPPHTSLVNDKCFVFATISGVRSDSNDSKK